MTFQKKTFEPVGNTPDQKKEQDAPYYDREVLRIF